MAERTETGPARRPRGGPGRHARPEPDASLERPFSCADLSAIAGAARQLVTTWDSGIITAETLISQWAPSAVAVLREVAQ